MSVDVRVARRYALALFKTATKHNVVRSIEDDLGSIVGLIQNDSAFRAFLLSPGVGREEKTRIVDKLFSDRVTALTMQGLRLVLEKRREDTIEAIFDEFVRLRREDEGALFVNVSSAEELTAKQKEQLSAKLALSTGKKIEAVFGVDPKLVGGVKVTFGNTVLDGTAQGSLKRIHETLIYDLLKQA